MSRPVLIPLIACWHIAWGVSLVAEHLCGYPESRIVALDTLQGLTDGSVLSLAAILVVSGCAALASTTGLVPKNWIAIRVGAVTVQLLTLFLSAWDAGVCSIAGVYANGYRPPSPFFIPPDQAHHFVMFIGHTIEWRRLIQRGAE